MAHCTLCGHSLAGISEALGVCLACIRRRPREALEIADAVHRQRRMQFGLPPGPPDHAEGVSCRACMNRCRIAEGQTGYCGLRRNRSGQLVGISATRGKFSWYHDPLPTNCVADRVCPGGTGSGFPQYAYRCGPETGYKNLAVFFKAVRLTACFARTGIFETKPLRRRFIRWRSWCRMWMSGHPVSAISAAIPRRRCRFL